jgi:dolichol-phosphate mannosyltransferase
MNPDVSVVVPIYNEAENIGPLHQELSAALSQSGCEYEIVYVDDGSTDSSFALLADEQRQDQHVTVVRFSRNYGQTAALAAGFDHAAGEVIVTLDADGQNDPADIPALLAKLGEGYDLVSGWRLPRQDSLVSRRMPSVVANALIGWITGVKLHDYGCTLKAMRREVVSGLRLYGEMHRFIPIYASWRGARVVEMPVGHSARRFGKSKYGLNRIFKVVLDLMVLKFLESYLVKPIYVFGGFGLFSILLSFITLAAAIGLKLFAHTSLIQTPLPLLAAMLFLMGCMSILLGLLAEIMTRTYFESQGSRPYTVRAPDGDD